jgi:nucleotide-binding universal stress UspA family protein
MVAGPSVLCPVDFSNASRGALRYAFAIAAHFGATLTVLHVDAADCPPHSPDEAPHIGVDPLDRLKRFFADTCPAPPDGVRDVRCEVAAGKPAARILRWCRDSKCDLVVMSSHGTGYRSVIFGSTTERVLRETSVPLLVTPGTDPGPGRLEDLSGRIHQILVPVDFTTATAHQVRVAHGLAEAFGVPALLLHVLRPLRVAQADLPVVPGEAERHFQADLQMKRLAVSLSARDTAEVQVATGEPGDVIASTARHRDAGLIVMALHDSPPREPRRGWVTYRVLCGAQRLVLALPPPTVASAAALMKLQPASTAS